MSIEDDMIEDGFSDMHNYLDHLMNKADAEWAKQEEEESKQDEWEDYLANLSDDEVESLRNKDKHRRNQNRVKREILLEKEKILNAWKEVNPNEKKIWKDKWSFKCTCYAYMIDSAPINEFDEWEKWLNKRNSVSQEMEECSQIFSNWQKDKFKEEVIAGFQDWVKLDENVNIDKVWNDLIKWKNDHSNDWNIYKEQFSSIWKENAVYEFLAWKVNFYWYDTFELWKSEHSEEWIIWKNINDQKWTREKEIYGFHKESFLVNEWKKAHVSLWNDWQEKSILEVQKWKTNDSEESIDLTKTYIKELKDDVITLFMSEELFGVNEVEDFDFEFQEYQNGWDGWKNSYIKNWESNYLQLWKNEILSNLRDKWTICFESYRKEKRYIENDIWAKIHMTDVEKRNSLENEYEICRGKWESYWSTLDDFWTKKEQELSSGIENRMIPIYEMKLFFIWRDNYPEQWNNWYERYLWYEQWIPTNEIKFREWVSGDRDSEDMVKKSFELWKKQNISNWNKWKDEHLNQWKIKLHDLDTWSSWVMNHHNQWNSWAESNSDSWRMLTTSRKDLEMFEVWKEDHFGEIDDFRTWKLRNIEDWEIWKKELEDRVERKKWNE